MQQDFINKHFFNLTLFTLIFGVMFYDIISNIGFSYVDEICALLLFILFGIKVFRSKNWGFDRLFLIVISVFLFYLVYSICIGSSSLKVILMDFFIQIKPYIAFFAACSLKPALSASQKKLLRQTALLLGFYLFFVGMGDLVIPDLKKILFGHPSRFATASSIVAILYLYCSNYAKKDKLVFLLLLSIGLFSGRSKLFGFLAMCTFMMIYINRSFEMRLNVKNTFFLLLAIAATMIVAKDKIQLYFITGGFSGGREAEDLYARMALYYFSTKVLMDYIPFGSGFASYATYASSVNYSHLYPKYYMDHMFGLTKANPMFIADTYYPALAQFGFVGVFLFFLFWGYLAFNAIRAFIRGCRKESVISLMIIVFFLIECTSDSTITHNRGFFMMMLLGLIFADIKNRSQTGTKQTGINSHDADSAGQ